LVGRRGDLDGLTGRLRDPSPKALAVEIVGDPGIGKTALLEAVLNSMSDRPVARAAATAVEQPLTWTGLAQLVDSWEPDDLVALSAAHRGAIDGVLGRSDGPFEPGLVATAFAALVAAATARGPAVIAVDDTHWLDDATAGVVAYAVRANRRRPVRLICARRPEPSPLQPERIVAESSASTHVLSGLSIAGVHDLLANSGVELTRPQLLHVHDATGGNPLHVLELARLLTGGIAVDDAVRQTSLESVIGRRVRALSTRGQMVLGAAALTATPTMDILVGCFDDGTVSAALVEAERAELITVVRSSLRFVHPTVGAAADAALGSVERRRLHGRLAGLVDDDERALHLDASTEGPDEQVADALDAAGRDAWERGATELAARRMIRAVDRTPWTNTELRWDRRIAAADMLLDTGAARDALALLVDDAEPTSPLDRDLAARVVRTRAVCRFQTNDEIGGAADAAEVAAEFPPGHPTRVDALLAQARMTLFFDVGDAVDVATLAAEEAAETGDQDLVDTTRACELSSRFLAGEPVTIPLATSSDSRRLTASELLDELLLWSDDLDRAEPQITERLARAEQRGDLATVANISQQAAEARIRRGDPRGAQQLYGRVLELASTMDDRAWITNARAALGLIDAYLGALDVATGHLDAARDGAVHLSPGDLLVFHSTAGTAMLLCGEVHAAVDHFRTARAVTLDLRLHDSNALPFRAQMVEALLAVGEVSEATDVSNELTRFAFDAGRTRGIGDAHRSAALVAAAEGDLEAARRHIEAAIVEHDRLPGPIEGAWSRLAAGIIERRRRKRAAARAHFEQALDVFRRTGAESLARRAEVELTRSGAPSGGINELTPAELQVAQLVVRGHTNNEVASMLHMSTKTVEANLTRIYRKLGVRSRTELAARTPS
jgi:DNA-binding CsgD family transcriptional regulator